MTICLPTVSDAGLSARLSPHFGRAPFFTLVETDTGTVQVLSNMHQQHEHGHCNPVGALGDVAADAVVCRGVGGHALALLEQRGLATYLTDEWTVGSAVDAFRSGSLTRMGLDDVCRH